MGRSRDDIAVRAPRVRVRLNGTYVDSILHLEATICSSCKSSRFEVTVSTGGSSLNGQWLDSATGPVSVTILIRSDISNAESVIIEGLADDIAFDPINRIARLQGRDYSSVLIDSSYQGAFCNQTASEIANQIAQRHGFTPNIVETETMVGSYQSGNYNRMLLNAHARTTSEWDLLTQLASTEGFELFVNGTTLVFAPPETLPKSNFVIVNNNAKSIAFHKSCPISNQAKIVVKSWNSWLNRVLVHTDEQSYGQNFPDASGLSSDPGSEIAVVRPNLTSQGTEEVAQRYLNALNRQVLDVEVVLPGNLSLAPRDVLTIIGNGPSFDADYVINSVRWHFSPTTGFTQYIRGYATGSNSSSSLNPMTS